MGNLLDRAVALSRDVVSLFSYPSISTVSFTLL